MGRSSYRLSDGEAAGISLARFDGTTVPTGRVMSLERRGWRRAAPQDAGVQPWMYRTLPAGGSVVISLEPGIAVGIPMEYSEEQTLESIWLSHHADGEWHRTGNRLFGELDLVTASELLRDLIEITAP